MPPASPTGPATSRGRIVVATALVVLLPGALWLIWQVQREPPGCGDAGAAYAEGAVVAHVVASATLLATASWAAGLRLRWLVLAAAYAALCLLVEEAWLPVAFAGFLLAAEGAGLVLLGLSALLLAYAVAHPRALHETPRRRDHARLLTVLLVLAALGAQGELALVQTAAERACGS